MNVNLELITDTAVDTHSWNLFSFMIHFRLMISWLM